jgi:hypothetical protein
MASLLSRYSQEKKLFLSSASLFGWSLYYLLLRSEVLRIAVVPSYSLNQYPLFTPARKKM